ncbi:ankyrin repeat domain-containing protein [Sabulibacter ruber]|uniref:ankyrin repeat domain-containing protein n=1 Tax=Sabulibacter ruber TaxID=2811901 RepID=UPI001A95EE23|nr:ankyrin repeat domain-containing protein [Sabulibacter ruber]
MAKPGRPIKTDPRAEEIAIHIGNGNIEGLKVLLKKLGIDATDGYSRTALLWASFYGNLDMLAWLIENGANINHQDWNGYSALHFAAQEKRIGIAELLLKRGANLELRDNHGNTPLWTAVFNARKEYKLVELYLKSRANLDNVNNSGRTPRQMAEAMFSADFALLLEENEKNTTHNIV